MPEQLDPAGSGADPLDALINEELRARLRHALRQLSSRCKQLIRLRLAGSIRPVYPTSTGDDRVLQPGLREFSFPASAPPDPPAGGAFTLRVFEVLALIPAPAQVDWAWVAMNSELAENTYTVTPSR
jgi:hypothetical protein